MHVLQLCHRIPYPPGDGGSIAMHQITQGLLDEGIALKVLALSPLPLQNNQEKVCEKYVNQTGFEAISIDTRIKVVSALINLFSKNSYIVERYHSRAVSKALKRILKENRFDIIQLEGLYLTPYIPLIRSLTNSPLIYRSHNIEHFIWQRLAQTAKHPLRKFYLEFLSTRLRQFETKVIHDVDGLVAISEIDRQFFLSHGYKGPSVVIPAGMPEVRFANAYPEPDYNSVFHLGSMDWRPNQDGVTWFLKKVWPLVIDKNPAITMYLAGRRMPDSFYQYGSDHVKVIGEVDNAMSFIMSKNLMVVPLLSGGGMRVKIIEGMAAGKTIISTHIGAEGIGCEHQKNILLADTPEEMAGWIVKCIEDRAFSEAISLEARAFAEKNYDMTNIIRELLSFYNRFYSN